MKKLVILVVSLVLCGCATVLTPQRCEQALSGLQTAAEITAVLIERGVEPETALKVANAITLSQVTLTAACASVRP